jgi:PleD family two-component response regulator
LPNQINQLYIITDKGAAAVNHENIILFDPKERRLTDADNPGEIIYDEKLPSRNRIDLEDVEEADQKLLVLAIDDCPDILMAVSAALCDDYKVFKLPRSASLEDVLKKVTPDLFLLDYQMPELNGFDLIPIIRELDGHKETPIIMLTSAGTIDHVSVALGLGACDYVVKPFDRYVLHEKVAKHIYRSKRL